MARYDFIAVYILANRRNGALYVGVTSNLPKRLEEHRRGGTAFTRKYGIFRLVHYERFSEMAPALQRERRLKEWKRQWKIDLIEKTNRFWDDLSSQLPYD